MNSVRVVRHVTRAVAASLLAAAVLAPAALAGKVGGDKEKPRGKDRDKDKEAKQEELTPTERALQTIGQKFPAVPEAYAEITATQEEIDAIGMIEDAKEKKAAEKKIPALKAKIDRAVAKLDRELPRAHKVYDKELEDLQKQEAEIRANIEKAKEKKKDPEEFYQKLDVVGPRLKQAESLVDALKEVGKLGHEGEAPPADGKAPAKDGEKPVAKPEPKKPAAAD